MTNYTESKLSKAYYVVEPNSVVMFRRMSDLYEPLTVTTKEPYLFSSDKVLVFPNNEDEYVPGLLEYEWSGYGYYVFIVTEFNEFNLTDKLLLLASKNSVLEVLK